MSRIGDNIRALREAAQITQDELAEKAGVNRVTIAKYEAGKIQPGAKRLSKLAAALHVASDVLLGNGVSDMSDEEQEIWQMREDMRRNPDLRGLWSIQRKATKEQLQRMRDFAEGVTGNGKIDETDTP